MQLSEKEKQGLFTVVFLAVLVGAGVWWYEFQFGASKVKGWQEKTEELNGQVGELEGKARKYRRLLERKAEILSLEKTVRNAASRFPKQADAAQFHKILADTVGKTGVYPLSVTAVNRVPREYFVEYRYQIECLARYHDLGVFFNLIEEHPERFMRVRSFSLDHDSKLVSRRPSVHHAKVEVVCYTYSPKRRPYTLPGGEAP